MTNIQQLPPEIRARIFLHVGARTPKMIVTHSMPEVPKPFIPMQNLLLASLVSPDWHTLAYTTFEDIHRATNPGCRTWEVFQIWMTRVRCLLERYDRWVKWHKLYGSCHCHGQDAKWIAGWDEVVQRIGRHDPGLRLWREWVEKVNLAKQKGRGK